MRTLRKSSPGQVEWDGGSSSEGNPKFVAVIAVFVDCVILIFFFLFPCGHGLNMNIKRSVFQDKMMTSIRMWY